MRYGLRSLLGFLALALGPVAVDAATLIFPQQRQAFFSAEPIELAVAGLTQRNTVRIELLPQRATLTPLAFDVTGDGSTVVAVLAPYTLAPSVYAVKLDGKEAAKISIASGLRDSTMLLSQMGNTEQLKAGGANFIIGNAFEFGQLDPSGHGPKTTALRGPRGGSYGIYEKGLALDLPTIVYMYWTGYVTHKPFGSEKSWAAADMTEAMRLLSFHAGQRLRRYAPTIVSVGCIDEPGLSWGKTPAGGMASGFPNRDEVPWYASRGWKFTDDPAARPADDWMTYMRIRCGILKEQSNQAKKDVKTSWPDLVFSTDLYAPHAIMDGTDPLNQQVNDIPSSHVFVDFGIDRLGAYSGMMLEKAHNPQVKLAHAMNGQLFAETVKQPQQTYAYRAALNGMMAAGLASNWWLNTGGMTDKDLASINNPAKKVGALLRNYELSGHDVAVLWSFTELALREQAITAREAKKKPGEQLKLLVTSLPTNSAVKTKELPESAYSVGAAYKESVLTAHYALARAGYPAHIVDERLLPGGALKSYKTLVVIGQTFALPKETQAAIEAFVQAGGKVVVDKSTTQTLPGSLLADLDFKGVSERWESLFDQDVKTFKTLKEASYFQTNVFMDQPVQDAVGPLKAVLQKTGATARLETASVDLLMERHFAGAVSVILVANAHKELPKIPDNEAYPIYQYAPYEATYRLKGLPKDAVVYVFEGADWSKVSRLADPTAEIHGRFEPAEMKIYVVAPHAPGDLEIVQTRRGGSVRIQATMKDLKMPWPLTVELSDANGAKIAVLHRATNAAGVYDETYALGTNLSKVEIALTAPLQPNKSWITGFDSGLRRADRNEANHSRGRGTRVRPSRAPRISRGKAADYHRLCRKPQGPGRVARGQAQRSRLQSRREAGTGRTQEGPLSACLESIRQGLPGRGQGASARRQKGRVEDQARHKRRRHPERQNRGW